MKKLLILLLLCFSLNIQANTECVVDDLKTEEEVESAQSCMISLLEQIDNLIKNQISYNERVSSTFNKLIEQAATCKKWEMLSETNPSSDFSYLVHNVEECQKYYDKRQEEYTYVMDEYNKAKKLFKGLEVDKQALELKIETLKQTYDLMLKNK